MPLILSSENRISSAQVLARVDMDTASICEVYHPGDGHLPLHAHRYANVTLFLGGHVEERTRTKQTWGSVGSVLIKPAGTEHADAFGLAGARSLVVEIRDLSCWPPIGDGLGLSQYRWVHRGPVLQAMLSILHAWRINNTILQSAVDELHRALFLTDSTGSRTNQSWMEKTVEAISDDPGNKVRVSDLANKVGCHPTYLTRRFRQLFGVSTSEYLRAARVRKSCRLLADRTHSLCNVAILSGFGDQSHFNRVFKQATGLTPSAFRSRSEIVH